MTSQGPFFFIPVFTGLIFIVAGVLFYKFPPKKINGFYGYRTTRAMKNQESWDFAQFYSSKQMMLIGLLLTLIGFIGLIYKPNEMVGVILGCGIVIAMVIGLFVKVERKLKEPLN